MRRSHVEGRSNPYLAKQFVSDFEIEGNTMTENGSGFRSQGTVKFYNEEKGFGFLKRDGAEDVFIHANELRRSGVTLPIKQGDRLEFDAVPVSGKGPKAVNVKAVT